MDLSEEDSDEFQFKKEKEKNKDGSKQIRRRGPLDDFEGVSPQQNSFGNVVGDQKFITLDPTSSTIDLGSSWGLDDDSTTDSPPRPCRKKRDSLLKLEPYYNLIRLKFEDYDVDESNLDTDFFVENFDPNYLSHEILSRVLAHCLESNRTIWNDMIRFINGTIDKDYYIRAQRKLSFFESPYSETELLATFYKIDHYSYREVIVSLPTIGCCFLDIQLLEDWKTLNKCYHTKRKMAVIKRTWKEATPHYTEYFCQLFLPVIKEFLRGEPFTVGLNVCPSEDRFDVRVWNMSGTKKLAFCFERGYPLNRNILSERSEWVDKKKVWFNPKKGIPNHSLRQDNYWFYRDESDVNQNPLVPYIPRIDFDQGFPPIIVSVPNDDSLFDSTEDIGNTDQQ